MHHWRLAWRFLDTDKSTAARKNNVRVTLLDRQNHHLFQPLLYQVATAALSPADIAEPLRHILRRQDNTEVIMGEAGRIDVDRKRKSVPKDWRPRLRLSSSALRGRRHLILRPRTSGSNSRRGLKSLDDALEIRRRMLLAFEIAEKTEDDDVRRASRTTCSMMVEWPDRPAWKWPGPLRKIARHRWSRISATSTLASTRILIQKTRHA